MPVVEKLAIREIDRQDTEKYIFFCPACRYNHWFQTNTKYNPSWDFNGDLDSPTVRPSILVQGQYRCHSYITDGQIKFLKDSDHKLAGKTVPLFPMEDLD